MGEYQPTITDLEINGRPLGEGPFTDPLPLRRLHRQSNRRAQRSGQWPAETGKTGLPRKVPATRPNCGCDESHGFQARLNIVGQDCVVLRSIIGAFREMSGDVKDSPSRHRYSGLAAHRGWERHLLDRRCLVGTSNTPRGYSNCNNHRSDHGVGTAHDSNTNPKPGFRAGSADYYDAA